MSSANTELILLARSLKSEGDNPEYDRALVEMIHYYTGTSLEDSERLLQGTLIPIPQPCWDKPEVTPHRDLTDPWER